MRRPERDSSSVKNNLILINDENAKPQTHACVAYILHCITSVVVVLIITSEVRWWCSF
jgi:hypothetical protein